MLLNRFRRLPVSRLTSIRFTSITSTTRCLEKSYSPSEFMVDKKNVLQDDKNKLNGIHQDLLNKNKSLNHQKNAKLNERISFSDYCGERWIKVKGARNEYLPRFFYELDKKQDIIKDCKDVLSKVEKLGKETSPDIVYSYKKAINKLMKHIREHYPVFKMYDKHFQSTIRKKSLNMRVLLYFMSTLYDPACVDRAIGWETTFENDEAVRDMFEEVEYERELHPMAKHYMKLRFPRKVFVEKYAFDEWDGACLDEYEYEGVVHEDDLYFYRNCIHTFNFLEYHDSVKLVSNLDEFSKKRCEYFFYYLASEAMKKANEIED